MLCADRPVAAARARRGAPAARGFSLLELLVVLFVVVIITSLVSINVNSGGQDVRLEAQVRRFADTALYALDEAQFTGVDYGLLLERIPREGDWVYTWSWRERSLEGWRFPASGKEVFEQQELPPGIEAELEIENAPFAEVELETREENRGPQVVLYASGETTVGALNLRRVENGELLWRVEWDLLGRFDVLRRGEPADGDLP